MSTGRLPSTDGGIQPTVVDAKGDLLVGVAADSISRLAVGSNDQVLTADSSTSTGLKWGTVSSGGETLLATHTANNTVTSYTTSSIASTYKHLMVVGSGIQLNDTVKRDLWFKFNSSSSSDYYSDYIYSDVLSGAPQGQRYDGQSVMYFSTNSTATVGAFSNETSDKWGNFVFYVYDYASSLYKSCIFGGGKYSVFITGRGLWNQTTAISAITIGSNVNFKAGTIKIYGVS